MKDFRNLKVWEKAHALTLAAYRVTGGFPRDELFGLTSQMRHAAVSVEANIAEGCCRSGDADFARFLEIAVASASELDCHLLIARDLSFLGNADYDLLANDVTEVKKMLTVFIRTLRADS